MLVLIIIGILLLLLLAILLIPVGVELGYEQETFRLAARLNGFQLQLIPRPPREEKPKKEKKPRKEKKKKRPEGEQPPGEKKQRKLDFSREELLELVRTALRFFSRFRRRLTVQRFLLHYTAAGDDPYNTAMQYAYVNAALSSLAPMCARAFHVRHSDVWTQIDFCAGRVRLDLALTVTIRIGQVLGLGLSLGFGALRILVRSRLRVRREARQAAKDALPEANETETNTIQEEERMAANG